VSEIEDIECSCLDDHIIKLLRDDKYLCLNCNKITKEKLYELPNVCKEYAIGIDEARKGINNKCMHNFTYVFEDKKFFKKMRCCECQLVMDYPY